MATSTGAPTPEDIAALCDEVSALKRELDNLARDREAQAQERQDQGAKIAAVLAEMERLKGNASADTATLAKLTEQRRTDAIVRLGERVALLDDIRLRDREVAAFTSQQQDAVPLYGYAAMECDELGGRDVYDAYKGIMKGEHLDPTRQGDREYGKALALKACGITLATATTLGQAIRLAESDEPVVLNEDKHPRSARAAHRVLQERPDLLGRGVYGSQQANGDHVVRASEGDATVQQEIADIVTELEDLPSSSPRRLKLERRLAKLMKPDEQYGWSGGNG